MTASVNLTANGGTAHRGFTSTQPLAEGTYTICAVAANLRWGANTSVGCKKITLNYGPVGALTAITQIPGGAKISGWATDPDSSGPVTVTLYDGAPASGTLLGTVVADVPNGKIKPNHQFTVRYTGLAQGAHTFCAVGTNIGPGQNQQLACRTGTLNFNPTATITSLTQTMTGVKIAGTATDPDTTDPVSVSFTIDGSAAGGTTTANLGSGHSYSATLSADDGAHKVCAVAQNLLYGTGNTTTCKTITLNYAPLGALQPLTRSPSDTSQLVVSGWALDQGTKDPVTVTATLDGTATGSPVTAGSTTPATPSTYTATFGTAHGFSFTVPADTGEHTVCLTATNGVSGNGAGLQASLGCKLIIAVNPVKPSAPQNVTAAGGYGGAQVTWTPPADDGGAPPTKYTVTSSPGNVSTTVTVAQPDAAPPSTTPIVATVVGLKPKTSYTFTVVATNVAGTSPSATSTAVITQASPPPQTSPAPVSTSRYIRNISSGSAAEQATMRAEGATDASYNPSGHGYLILLDIGGQDSYDGGVVLSATTRFVTYSALVADLKAYVDGYASSQKPSAPVVIAIGTNNDMDVTKAAGADWANKVVDPVVSYAAKYSGVTIACANDVEPGFRGTYSQSRAWLTGYLAATKAPFVFNGSADGCSWTAPAKGCNNGWTMAGLYQLAGGLAPTRIVNLPQIYNTTMPKQWKYISLTGVNAGSPRINFGGPLTEWTACDQAGGCGSITGVNAWQQLWTQLQSAAQLKVGSLPYSTDLRIDK